jgi:DeoR family transcriptional regulator of aga operon
LTDDEFEAVLSSVVQRNLIPGLAYDGFEAFLIEEHSSWKAQIQHKKKEIIGRRAASLIQNGAKIIIDAGSTTEEIARIMIKKIENRLLNKLTVATTSINIGDMVSDCCVKMGFDDEFSAIRLFIPGGQVRPNTQAIIPAFGNGPRQILTLSDALGGFDLCFVGVNGVEANAGFTTHENLEAANKLDMINVSKTRVIVGDSSKVGLTLDYKFADFDDKISFVVDDDQDNAELQFIVSQHKQKIILA